MITQTKNGHGRSVPPRIVLLGEGGVASKFINIGKKELVVLEDKLAVDGADIGNSTVHPIKGVSVHCSISGGQKTIIIKAGHVPPVEIEEEIERKKDLRFFCRVGPPNAVDLNAYGEIVRDETLFYWVDFGALSGEDKIMVYPTSGDFNYFDKDSLRYTVVPYSEIGVGDNLFSQVKAVDIISNGATKRFAMGNHWLNDHNPDTFERNFILQDIYANNIMDSSLEGTNRLFINIEDGIFVWFHVLQDWVFGGNNSTGQINGYVYKTWFDVNEGAWLVSSEISFDVGPTESAATGITTYASGLTVPFCLVAGLYSISDNEIILSVPYLSECILFTLSYSFDMGGSASVSSFEHVDQLYRHRMSTNGFERESNGYSNVFFVATPVDESDGDTFVYYAGCSSFGAGECDGFHLLGGNNTYVKDYRSGSAGGDLKSYTFTMELDSKSYYYSYIGSKYTGTGTGFYDLKLTETITCDNPACVWAAGACGASVGHWESGIKYAEIRMRGTWLYTPNAYTPGNNTDLIFTEDSGDSGILGTADISLGGLNCGPSGGIRSEDNCGCVRAVNPLGYGPAKNFANRATPNHCSDTTDAGFVCTIPWKVNYPWGKEFEWIDNGIVSPPPGSWSAVSDTWHFIASGTGTTTTDDVYAHYTDSLEFSYASCPAVIYLDDRTTSGTHGLCIASKDWFGVVSSVFHGEDGVTAVTRDKYDDLRAKLIEKEYMEEGWLIYDMGLV